MRLYTTILLAALLSPTLALAQAASPAPLPTTTQMNTRDFLNIEGAQSTASARLTFYRTEEEELCTALGVRRGPKTLNKGFFKFTRLITVDGETREIDIKFKFPKQKSASEKSLWIWHACEESREPIEGSEKDMVRVTVRRPGFTPTKMWVNYPPEDAAFGLNIRTDSSSELKWTTFAEDHPDAG